MTHTEFNDEILTNQILENMDTKEDFTSQEMARGRIFLAFFAGGILGILLFIVSIFIDNDILGITGLLTGLFGFLVGGILFFSAILKRSDRLSGRQNKT